MLESLTHMHKKKKPRRQTVSELEAIDKISVIKIKFIYQKGDSTLLIWKWLKTYERPCR